MSVFEGTVGEFKAIFEAADGGFILSLVSENRLFKSEKIILVGFENLDDEEIDLFFRRAFKKMSFNEAELKVSCEHVFALAPWGAKVRRIALTEEDRLADELARAHAEIESLKRRVEELEARDTKLSALVCFEYKEGYLTVSHNAAAELRARYDDCLLSMFKESLWFYLERHMPHLYSRWNLGNKKPFEVEKLHAIMKNAKDLMTFQDAVLKFSFSFRELATDKARQSALTKNKKLRWLPVPFGHGLTIGWLEAKEITRSGKCSYASNLSLYDARELCIPDGKIYARIRFADFCCVPNFEDVFEMEAFRSLRDFDVRDGLVYFEDSLGNTAEYGEEARPFRYIFKQ